MRPTDTFLHEKDTQNLEVLRHFLSHYAHPSKVEYAPKLRLKNMVPLMLKNKHSHAHCGDYGEHFAAVLRVPAVALTMTANEAYHALLAYLTLSDQHKESDTETESESGKESVMDLSGDSVVMALVSLLRREGNSHHRHLWPQNALHIQKIIDSVSEMGCAAESAAESAHRCAAAALDAKGCLRWNVAVGGGAKEKCLEKGGAAHQ